MSSEALPADDPYVSYTSHWLQYLWQSWQLLKAYRMSRSQVLSPWAQHNSRQATRTDQDSSRSWSIPRCWQRTSSALYWVPREPFFKHCRSIPAVCSCRLAHHLPAYWQVESSGFTRAAPYWKEQAKEGVDCSRAVNNITCRPQQRMVPHPVTKPHRDPTSSHQLQMAMRLMQ